MQPSTRLRSAVLAGTLTAGIVLAATAPALAAGGDPPPSAPAATTATPEDTVPTTPETTVTTTTAAPVPPSTPDPVVAPVAVNDEATIYANHTATVNVLANDTAPAGSTVQLWNGSAPVGSLTNLYGTWSVSDGQVVHTPPDGRAGPRTIQYVLEAPDGQRSIATVRVQVNSINPPLILGNNTSTTFGAPATIDVLANDLGGSNRDSERYPLVPDTLRLVSPGGEVVTGFTDDSGDWSVVGGLVHYAPAPGFWGNVSVDYRVSDSVRQVGRGWISMAVLPTPDAVDDDATGAYGTTVVVPVTANDSTPPNTTFQLIGLVGANGNRTSTVVQDGIGTWTYTGFDVAFAPLPEFVGTASVPYRLINSRNSSDDAVVSVTVESPAMDAADDSVDAVVGGLRPSATVDVLANDTSADGATIDPSTLALVDAAGEQVAELVIEGEGRWAVVDAVVEFTPDPAFTGPAEVVYTIANDRGGSDTATITINVSRAAVTTVDDWTQITFKQLADVDALANDSSTGASLDPSTLVLVAPDGSLVDSYRTRAGEWSVVDGRVQFDPVTRFRGTATATYAVDNGFSSGTGVVVVRVVPPGHHGDRHGAS